MWLDGLEVHHLRFDCTARTAVHLGPQAGAQLRGALWEAIQHSISNTDQLEEILQLEIPTAARGSNPARPFVVRPPLADDPAGDRYFPPEATFSFGISLFGRVIDLYPYLVQAVYEVGKIGVGYGRGQFLLDTVYAENPLTGDSVQLMENRRLTTAPSIPVTAEQVIAYSYALSAQDHIRLRFQTPTQLTGAGKRLLSEPDFETLIVRLVERCQQIGEIYADVATPREAWRDLHLTLSENARTITRTACHTRWIDVRSGSRRANTGKKISGFVGEVVFSGGLAPFLPWIVWGQSVQVGKNTVKGAGWYEIV